MADATGDAGLGAINASLEPDKNAPKAGATAADGVANGGVEEIVYRQLSPHLVVKAPYAGLAIDFYKKAFGAEEVTKSFHPKRKADCDEPLILHAHLKFGGAQLMICDEAEETGPTVKSATTLNATTCILHLVVNDVEAAFARAVKAGASVTEAITDQPWGQRYGKLMDPFGFVWSIATPLGEREAMEIPPPPIAVL